MFHEVQARTLSSLRDADLLPVTLRNLPNALAALDESTRVVEEAFRDRLEPAIERVWEDEVGRIGSDLRIWLRRMANESGLWRPIHFELAFGLPTDPAGGGARDPESSPQAVKIAGGYPLRGAVDLVEASTGADTLRVTDHKTGVDRTQPGMIAGGGQTLQPLLYALAVENMLGRKVTESRLYFATSRGGYRDRVVPMDERARLYAREVLEVIDRSVVNGVLPPTPIADRSGRVACDWCDFLSVCGSRERQRTARKDEKLIRDLDELRRMP
jgi:CRISPR/Cas system-associated exonuclease Cas4 (RecB family)